MITVWLLLMVWASSFGGVAAPTVVTFHSEAECRAIGAKYEKAFPRRNRNLPPYIAYSLEDWRCVKGKGND